MTTEATCPEIRKGQPCGKPIRAGGKCLTCYQRARRQAAGAKPASAIGAETTMGVRMTSALRAQLDALAEQDGVDLSAVVRAACEAYVAMRAVGDEMAATPPKAKVAHPNSKAARGR